MKKSQKKHRHHPSPNPVRAKKFLGQHFLKDEPTAARIADTIDTSPTTAILEIGPGTGVLTQHLLKKDLELTVMEIDRESVAYLKEGFKSEHPLVSHKKFELIAADFLQYDLTTLYPEREFAIIGNFPYNISSQILFKTLEFRNRIPFFSGMFQKEVAKRICEGPGTKTYGILSVLTQAFYRADYLFSVPPSVFSPPPKVDSGVLQLRRKENFKLDCDEPLFFKVVKKAFQQRRKTLRNSLKGFELADTLKDHPLFAQRPEQLSVEEFVVLTNLVAENRRLQ